ncbi:hypothetical protein [Streptomyces sp. 8N706]|uniref:hypothetical protein n=1 Tax=Streptomyces sp. 8N706 TaxID=3457416 RepID=UPI003FD27B0A
MPPYQLRPDLPGAFDAYLLRMPAKQPDDRPTAEEVAHWFSSTAWCAAAEQALAAEGTGTATMYPPPKTSVQPSAAAPWRRTPSGQHPGTPGTRTIDLHDLHVRARAHMRRHKTLTGAIAGFGTFLCSAQGERSPSRGPREFRSGSLRMCQIVFA